MEVVGSLSVVYQCSKGGTTDTVKPRLMAAGARLLKRRQSVREKIKVAGYAKLAKLWEKRRSKAVSYHHKYYEEKFGDSDVYELADVYVDITGNKQIVKRIEMIRLLKDCMEGKVQCIATQTKGYLAADTREFCYLFKFMCDIGSGIHLITEDDNYNIDTVTNEDMQLQALLKMAKDYIALNPSDYESWQKSILTAISKL